MGQIVENKSEMDVFNFSNNPQEVYAIDNDFITKRPDAFLHDKVKVFARISP